MRNCVDIPSSSNSTLKYKVCMRDDGSVTCNCPSWRFQSANIKNRHCKHTDMVFPETKQTNQKQRVNRKAHKRNRKTKKENTGVNKSENRMSKKTKKKSGRKVKNKEQMENKDQVKNKDQYEMDRKKLDPDFVSYQKFVHHTRKDPVLEKHKPSRPISIVRNWFGSEKLNGVFIRWDGQHLRTKNGRILKNVPERIRSRLPPFPVDGELYAGIGRFHDSRLALYGEWSNIVDLWVFDTPDLELTFAERYTKLVRAQQEQLKKQGKSFKMVPFYRFKDEFAVKKFMEDIWQKGAEGIVFKNPKAKYQAGKRTRDVLKWKPTRIGTTCITEIIPGKRGVSLLVEYETTHYGKIQFKLVDQTRERSKTWKVGDCVQFAYFGITENGKPEFPVLIDCVNERV
jgi:DNA ligase-1